MFKKLLYVLVLLPALSCSEKHLGQSRPTVLHCDTVAAVSKSISLQLGIDTSLTKTKTGVYTLENGGESLIARAWLWQHSQKTIDIQHYIFKKDVTGKLACNYLVRAANRGVKIRILLDEVAVKKGVGEMGILDSHENIEIKIYNPGLRFSKNLWLRIKNLLTKFKRLTRRMHIKTISVDGQVSIMGGRNIADEYFDFDHHYNFRDRDIVMFGGKCEAVTETFNQHWFDTLSVPLASLKKRNKKKYANPHRYDHLYEHACNKKKFPSILKERIVKFPHYFDSIKRTEYKWLDNLVFIADVPGKNAKRNGRAGGVCTDSVFSLISRAKKTIVLQSPYVIFDDKTRELFARVIERGVRVKVLTNSMESTDNLEAFSGYQRDREKILDMGVDIYEFKPHPAERYKIMDPAVQSHLNYAPRLGLHAKTLIIDDTLVVIGTYNIDPRSADLNTECIAVAKSEPFAKVVLKYIDEEFLPGNAWHVTKDFNPDNEAGIMKRVKVFIRKVLPKKML